MSSDRVLPLHAAVPLTNSEPPFEVEELFFSRTDPAGLMQSGNSVFQRVSGYTWDELIGKPHKLIRHPGTPRAVFHVLWEAIKAGRPVGAYVRNKTKSGGFYWVFAVVTPIDGGYLSVRLKPTSDLFPEVQKLYAAHAEMEQATRITPSESADKLRAVLADLGFRDYCSFSSTALAKELAARAKALGRAADGVTTTLHAVSDLAANVLARATAIQDAYGDAKHAPMNFSLEAARAGSAGAATGVVAANYHILAKELNDTLDGFVQSAQSVTDIVARSLFLAGTAALQREMHAVFHGEDDADCAKARYQDMMVLDGQQEVYSDRARESLTDVLKATDAFGRSCVSMGRLASALEVTRIMGKVEWAKVGMGSTHMDALFDEFAAFQTAVRNGLRELDRLKIRIRSQADNAMRMAA